MAGRTGFYPKVIDETKEYIEKANIPSVAGLAIHLGKARSTLYKWAGEADKKEFSDILETLLSTQEERLINNGLSGKYNSTITKLMLGKHGYTDKTETDLTSKGESIKYVIDFKGPVSTKT